MNTETFWSKVDKSGDCWIWTAGATSAGYGLFKHQYAHRISYRLHRGEIPEGLELDHLCRVTRCVNPDHLEAVTHAENVRRGMSPPAIRHRAGTCALGHPFVVINGGKRRYCRICHTRQENARRARKAAAA